MMDMAYNAVQYKDNIEHVFNDRECMHLQALNHLLQDQYPTALITYLKILRSCPGDALAMSLAMDLAHVLGDKQAALRYVPREREKEK
jgi:Tfp pilus assembly protein PilF